uniref:AlNc14C107G6252 protein n=1 Tax=Albugo laibachii Nc14 TaxID=890382 RepID=F0WI45_9STRA|nr:AlNc14C107G6252 [Albugo laibachii Nc14]|eukprot:CCA20923.1 AlNc14C107G6252 [Albugo laibachii Nc14]
MQSSITSFLATPFNWNRYNHMKTTISRWLNGYSHRVQSLYSVSHRITLSLSLHLVHFVLLSSFRIYSGKKQAETKAENARDTLIVRFHLYCIQILTAILQILELYLVVILLSQSTLLGPTYYLSLSRPIFNFICSGLVNNVHRNTFYRILSILICCQIIAVGLISYLALSLFAECVSSRGSPCSRVSNTFLLNSTRLIHLKLHDTGSIFFSIWLAFEIALICIYDKLNPAALNVYAIRPQRNIREAVRKQFPSRIRRMST